MFGFVGSAALRSLNFSRSLPRFSCQNICSHRARSNVRMSSSGPSVSGDTSPSMVRARHILVDSEAMIDSIQKQLEEGKASFEELAGMVSTCNSKENGGDLGWFKRSMMVKEFEDAAFSNVPGSLVKVQTEFGWHLIKVEDHGKAPKAITILEYDQRFGKNGKDDPSSVQLIDCREKEELEQASLPNFVNLPMGEYNEWADQFAGGQLGLRKDKETIVMCHHGVRSANFCSFLSQQGFTYVRNLIGGIDAYAKKMDPSVPLY